MIDKSLRSTIIELKRGIYDQLGIPLHHWFLTSCGGRLLLDSRTLTHYGIRHRAKVLMRIRLKGGAPVPRSCLRKRQAPWSSSKKSNKSEQLSRTTFSLPRRSKRLNLKRRKTENEKSLDSHTESSVNQANQLNKTRFQEDLADSHNSVAVKPLIFGKSFVISSAHAHTGLSQELEDLTISDNPAFQTGCKGKSANIDSTTFDKLVTEDLFNKSVNSNHHPNIPQYADSLQNQVEDSANGAKQLPKLKSFKPREVSSKGYEQRVGISENMRKAPVFQEDFAEVCLNNEWVKLEILKRNVDVDGVCLAQRLDGCGQRLMVNTKDLVPFGSNDQESWWQIRKRVEFEKVKELLEKEVDY